MAAIRSKKPKTDASPLTLEPESGVLAQRLSVAGLRVTSNRIAVLEALGKEHRPMSHSDIDAIMPIAIDRVTLYRTLESCVSAGLVSKEVGADRISRFAVMVGDQPDHQAHAHFHCDGCGRTYCLPARAPRKIRVPDGFKLTAVDVQAHGECADCGAERT